MSETRAATLIGGPHDGQTVQVNPGTHEVWFPGGSVRYRLSLQPNGDREWRYVEPEQQP